MIYGYARCSTEPENIKFSGSFVLLLQQSHLQSSRGLCNIVLVEHRGVEPLASTMRMLRAPNCANTPYGPGGNRTRVQKPIPCTSTIIVSSFSFPLPHGN